MPIPVFAKLTSVISAGKKGTTEHAAVWVPDSEASTCMHCLKSKFTALNRRVSSKKAETSGHLFVLLALHQIASI